MGEVDAGEYEELALKLGLHVDEPKGDVDQPEERKHRADVEEKPLIEAGSDVGAREARVLKMSPVAFIRHFERYFFMMGFLFVVLCVVLSSIAVYYIMYHVLGVFL